MSINTSSIESAFARQLNLEIGSNQATAVRRATGVADRFDVLRVPKLTADVVTERVLAQADGAELPLLVVFERASPQARELLRDRGISYASDSGELFLVTPRLLVDREAPAPAKKLATSEERERVSPFSRRASRIARWLLLSPERTPSIGELASVTDLSRPFASQVVRALGDRALIDVAPDENDSRARRVRVREPGALLDAWADAWRVRPFRQLTWDIATGTVADTVDAWSRAVRQANGMPWALGGLVGAERVVRAVEPADVLIWIDPADLEAWAALLVPQQVRAGRALLRVGLAPDPWGLSLAWDADGERVADPAQLYLDCEREGERALEAAAAIRRVRGW